MIRAGSLILQEGRQWAVSALVDPPVTIPGGAMIHWHPSNDSARSAVGTVTSGFVAAILAISAISVGTLIYIWFFS
jgi:hypothetical protein